MNMKAEVTVGEINLGGAHQTFGSAQQWLAGPAAPQSRNAQCALGVGFKFRDRSTLFLLLQPLRSTKGSLHELSLHEGALSPRSPSQNNGGNAVPVIADHGHRAAERGQNQPHQTLHGRRKIPKPLTPANVSVQLHTNCKRLIEPRLTGTRSSRNCSSIT